MVHACTAVVSTVTYPFRVGLSLLGDLIQRVCNAVRNFFMGPQEKPPQTSPSMQWDLREGAPSGNAIDCCALGFLRTLALRGPLTRASMKQFLTDETAVALRYGENTDFAQIAADYGFSVYIPANRPPTFEQKLTDYVQSIAQNQGSLSLVIRVDSTNMLSLGLFGSTWWLLDPSGRAVYRTEDQARIVSTVRRLVPEGSECRFSLLQKKAQ